MRKKVSRLKYYLLFLFCAVGFSVNAQVVCPPNIDFELGNTTNWSTYIGTCCPITTPTLTASPLVNRHTITSGTGVDMYGGFPIVSPGGTYSLKLGNNGTGAQAEKVRYYVHVPATAANFSIHYKYAVIFQDPGHLTSQQPRFEVNAFDSATSAPVPCAQYTYVSSVGLPGFLTSPLATVSNIIYYKPWTTESINLSGWGGSTIVVDFATGDCSLGGHFGYAYLDAQCGLFTAAAVACDSTTPVTLTAPPGFASYQWFDSATFSTSYGTTQIVTVPFPTAGSSMTYAVILTPYAGFGCPDTLYVNVSPSTIILGSGPVAGPISGPSTVCLGSSIVLSCSPIGGTWSSSSPGVASVDSTGLVTGLSIGTTTISYTVSNSCGTDVATKVIRLDTVSTGPIDGPTSVCEGSSVTLTCLPSGGTWSASPPGIVSITSSGLASATVTGVSPGVTIITYTAGLSTSCSGGMATMSFTVNPVPGTITGNVPFCIGTTITLGNIATGGTWSITPVTVATISSGGIVTGVSGGTATVSYVAACGTMTAIVTVNPIPGLITGDSTLCQGISSTLSNSAPGGTWSCTPSSIATINSSGIITGVAPGTATVTYVTTCGTVTTVVTVYPLPTVGTVSSLPLLCPTFTGTLTCTPPGGIWTSSSPSVATVSTGGVVTAVAGGTTTISYTYDDGTCSNTATRVVSVSAVTPPGTIGGPSAVCQGSTIALSCPPTGGSWTSSTTTVATVTSITGIVIGVSAGTTTITYSKVYTCGTIISTKVVTVNASGSITITGPTSVCAGSSITLTSAATGGTWTSGNTTVATVGTGGVVSGVSPGTAVISYSVTSSCGSPTATRTITVNAAPTAGTITGPSSVCVGSTISLSGSPAGGTWVSSVPTVATIGTSGTVSGVSGGTTTISYTLTNSCGATTTTSIVTVNPSPGPITGNTPFCVGLSITLGNITAGGTWNCAPATVATISPTGMVSGIAAGTATVSYVTTCGTVSTIITINASPGAITGNIAFCQGGTITLGNPLAGGTWSCSPSTVATIGSSGIVTGVSAGTATVSYVTTCGTVSTIITVNPLPGAITGNTPFCQGSTIALGNSLTGGTWSCAPTSIATINTSGVVTGVATGTATVSYVTTCGTVTTIVTVTPLPGAITGSVPFCQASTITLSNSLAGGTWSCAPSTVATISSTGIVTGVSAGTATVSYVTTCGTVSVIITVNPLPGPIMGNGPFCQGSTITLSNTVAGGTWSCAPTSIATINSSGIVTGVAAGTATVSYVTTCGTVTTIITVTPLPGAITGNIPFCQGSTITLSNSLGGGTWSCAPSTVATISSIGIVTGISAGTATVSYVTTCGTVSAIITVNPLPGAITGNNPFCQGSTITLGNPVAGGAWSCAPTSIATISTSGVVTGVATGTATVSYITACGTASTIVTVIATPAAITGNTPFCQGTSIALANILAGGVWSCAPATVATIDASGTVTGVATGTATVSYTTTCGTVSIMVTVLPLPGTITGSVPFCQGNTITLSNSLAGGTWSCSPTSVATVSTSGVVTGVAAGTAMVSYVTSCGTVTTVITVTPLPGAIAGNAPFCQGSTITLSNSLAGGTWSCTPTIIATISTSGIVTGVATGTATVSYVTTCGAVTAVVTVTALPGVITGNAPVCQGSNIALSNSLAGGTWSCAPTSIATISSSGVVTGISGGTATVSYVTTCGTVSIIVTVIPLPGPITGNTPICQGSTITLSNALSGGTWSSSPTSVATINAFGNVTAVAAGTATISYTTTCGSASVIVTVIALPGPITGNIPLCQGSTIHLSNSLTGGTWSCTPTSIATITSSGNVTGINGGTATVSYTTACGSVSTIVTVNPLPGAIGGNVPICAGGTLTLTNTVAGGTWSSSSPSIATIGSTGIVTGVAAGTASILYSNSCGTASVIVTVNPLPGPITGNTPICVGTTLTLGNPITGGSWSCAPASVATISSAGTVIAIAPGIATVFYSNSCGTVSIIVTVNPMPGSITGNTPVCVGNTITLGNSLPGGTWSITPATVATINTSGIVAAVAPGTAIVSYVTICGTVTAVVTVTPLPGVITGNIPFCQGHTITLSNPIPGGAWSCAPVSVATISSSGVVSGISPGTATVSYAVGYCTTYVVVTVNPSPNIAGFSFVNPICGGPRGSITLTGLYPGVTYTVHCTSTTTVSTSAMSDGSGNVVIGDLISGTYWLSVTNSYGCTSNIVGPVTLTDVGIPVAPIATAGNICEGDTLKLNVSPIVSGVIYHWAGPDGFTTTTTSPYIYPARPGNDGTYSVVATLGLCTSGATIIPVIVHPEPRVMGILSNSPGSCYGSDGWIALTGLTSGETYTVNYLFNGTSNTATITADGTGALRITGLSSGTYSGFVLVSAYGCVSKPVGPVTLLFAGKPPKPVIDHNNPCIGQTLLLNANDAMPGGTYTWAYPDGGGAAIKNPIRHNVQTSTEGVYTVTYTVAGCPTSDTATITFYLPLTLYDVTHDQTIKYGASIQLNASGAIFYRWVPNDGTLNNPNINNPLATPLDSTTYTVYGSNGGGCTDSAKVTILVEDDIDEYIPTAFTPNGDGLNDIFRIRNMKTQKLVEFSIYNRYGERIYFNSYQKDAGWDGTYKGVPQDMGVYFYYIIVGLRTGVNRIYKGDVTLIR